MTKAMLIRLILDSATGDSMKDALDAIDDYAKEVALAFYDEVESIPAYLMDTSFDHFIEKLNLQR